MVVAPVGLKIVAGKRVVDVARRKVAEDGQACGCHAQGEAYSFVEYVRP